MIKLERKPLGPFAWPAFEPFRGAWRKQIAFLFRKDTSRKMTLGARVGNLFDLVPMAIVETVLVAGR